VGSMAFGVFVSLLCSEVSGYVIQQFRMTDMHYITTTITPLIEETLKAVPIIVYAFLFSDKRETLLSIAFGMGVGFALLENIVILLRAVMKNPDSVSYVWAFVRGFGSGLMHAVATMMVGICINAIRKKHKLILPGIFAVLVMAATYHAIYNELVQTDLKYYGFILPLVTYIALVPLTFKGRIGVQKKEVI
ncbi:MAG: PrsW family glutamic-type intramembrane protease, partial [Eubacterium sp.]|nr:PrsW family glutamic-type intramembrane protease [Eubacterium sp.]